MLVFNPSTVENFNIGRIYDEIDLGVLKRQNQGSMTQESGFCLCSFLLNWRTNIEKKKNKIDGDHVHCEETGERNR